MVSLGSNYDGHGLCTHIEACRYFVRVTIMRRMTNIVKEREVSVHTLSSYPEMNNRYVYWPSWHAHAWIATSVKMVSIYVMVR
jgi:hypothetical protein